MSLIPFATKWVGANHARVLPAATYGVVALGAALAYFALVRAILRANVDDDVIVAAIGRDVKGMASPVIYVAGCGLAFASRTSPTPVTPRCHSCGWCPIAAWPRAPAKFAEPAPRNQGKMV